MSKNTGYSEHGWLEPGYSEHGWLEPGYSEHGLSEPGYSEHGYPEVTWNPVTPNTTILLCLSLHVLIKLLFLDNGGCA